MQKILVAIDFSDASELVLQKAQELAKATGAHLHLVHSIDQTTDFYDIYGYTVPDMTDFEAHASKKALASLEEQAKRLALLSDQTSCEILHGTPTEALQEIAEKTNPDLIMLGTHGHNALARALIGSTAERLLHKALYPLLLVPVARK